MLNWGLLIAVLLSTAVLTWIVIRFNARRGWLDRPVARSAHDRPMPSAGGVAMVLTFLAALGITLVNGSLDVREGLVFSGCVAVVAVGLADDIRTLSIRWRLPIQLAAALWVVYWVRDLPAVQFGPWHFENGVLIHILAVLSFVWLLNLFNFMDGIDGLAASETVFVTLLSCLLVINSGDQAVSVVASLLCATALGFLYWNWAPAKIFMGDVGSNFLGYSLGALAMISLANGSMNIWTWVLLLGVFVVDATYTLGHRVITGQRWYEGHNSHGYQNAARRLGSHQRTTLAVLTINFFWLAPLAWLANRSPDNGMYLAVLGLLPLVLLDNRLGAGKQGQGRRTYFPLGDKLTAASTDKDF